MKSVKFIRQAFLDFFRERGHKIVPAAPIVNQNDPTLMFVNSGMAQFKDYFLGNQLPSSPRIADTQKCLRVSGKHNDLEDVGKDGYHLTMFEMLGNWSFGDYFKAEAIAWSWELLTEVYQIPKDRIYVTVFGGDEKDGVPADEESVQLWLRHVEPNRILRFGKKDNFWEMGATGPCGPCTEIHVDVRPDAERQALPGADLVNMDHPQVIEIWNNVFMEFERRADSSLIKLPKQHVDTGMGLERLCMVLQGKTSSYDTDVFRPIIQYIEEASGKTYTGSYAPEAQSDTAMRVVADHIRAVSLVIADGQLPSNGGAGYVVRRILRRAVRYYFSFLGVQEPLLYRLLPILADMFAEVFPEVKAQESFIASVIRSEEEAFLRTLAAGLRRIDELQVQDNKLSGQVAFELYDTYGFPIDLTGLIATERGWTVDEAGFEAALAEQKNRSRKDAEKQTEDWVELDDSGQEVQFMGYDQLNMPVQILKYRKVMAKNKASYQVVLDRTPFYPEGGGQIGDTGLLQLGGKDYPVLDTKKENNLILHILDELPAELPRQGRAVVDATKRHLTENNHSATHLLHAALRQVLGTHVQQKGSLVTEAGLRFDFSHFQKLEEAEIEAIERLVNAKIRENISLMEHRQLPLEEARQAGAMMLFGEKYGETVRMITFDPQYSRELCGGCHVPATGRIGQFKIVAETAVAAGVRRIEALTAEAAEAYCRQESQQLGQIRQLLKSKDLVKSVAELQEQHKEALKQIEKLQLTQAQALKGQLLQQAISLPSGIELIAAILPFSAKEATKQLCVEIQQLNPKAVLVFGAEEEGKAMLTVSLERELAEAKGIHAGKLVKELAQHIQGGGGGQPFFATAGGTQPQGLEAALKAAQNLL